MANNIKSIYKNIKNVSTLTVKADSDSNKSAIAEYTCERFCCLANTLPFGAFIGWQLSMKDLDGVAFSSGEVKVTAADFKWIFSECADIDYIPNGLSANLYRGNRKVYALCPVRTSDGSIISLSRISDTGYGEEVDTAMGNWLNEIIEMMKKTDTIMQVIAGNSGTVEKQAMILISLSEEIPFRMRALFSLIFPYIKVKELSETLEEREYLTGKYLTEVIEEILFTLMCDIVKKEHIETVTEEADKCVEFEDYDEVKHEYCPMPLEDSTPIENLELSVRAYNCLKRAGILTFGDLKALKEDELKRIRNLSVNCVYEIKEKMIEWAKFSKIVCLKGSNYMEQLDELIGLNEVKAQIKKIVAFAKMNKDLSEKNGKDISLTLNMEFTGNPGTAKTTVARIVAGIFYEIGLLKSNEIVEVGRADLIASYTGQTAGKVKDVFEMAKGKVLFIDEAYSLVENWKGTFGDEAINTIVQEMENNRKDTVVIFAGYPDEMRSFFARNPGLRSRVPFSIAFNDYSTHELMEIIKMEADKNGFDLDKEAYEKLDSLCAMAAGVPAMGNGRFCRNLVENALLNYALRVYGGDGNEEEKNCRLIAADFEYEAVEEEKKKGVIGF